MYFMRCHNKACLKRAERKSVLVEFGQQCFPVIILLGLYCLVGWVEFSL